MLGGRSARELTIFEIYQLSKLLTVIVISGEEIVVRRFASALDIHSVPTDGGPGIRQNDGYPVEGLLVFPQETQKTGFTVFRF